MVVSYAAFGVQDRRLYEQYLVTCQLCCRHGGGALLCGHGVGGGRVESGHCLDYGSATELATEVAGVGGRVVDLGGSVGCGVHSVGAGDCREYGFCECGGSGVAYVASGLSKVEGETSGVLASGAVDIQGCERAAAVVCGGGSIAGSSASVVAGADVGASVAGGPAEGGATSGRGVGGGGPSVVGVNFGSSECPRGPVTLPRGPNFFRNQSSRLRKKAQKQARKARVQVGDEQVGVVDKTEAQKSLELLWQARNEMEIAKLARERRVMEATDLQQVIKQKRARLLKMTERDLVAVEKAHKQLEQSGNVPGVVPGFAETLVDSDPSTAVSGTPVSGGTISPNSSISQAEVQQLMKDHADVKAQNAVLSRALLKMGIDPKSPDECKNTWTLASNGDPVELELMDELGLDGYVPDITADGKAVVRLRAQGFY